MIGWLTPFDTESPYAPRRVDLLHLVTCGERRDYAWVRVDPPIAPGEAANEKQLDYLLLAPRHEGQPLALPVDVPVHVHVCTVRGATTEAPLEIDASDVEIRHRGILAGG